MDVGRKALLRGVRGYARGGAAVVAKQQIRNSPKFLRLCKLTKESEPHALGHLQYLWMGTYDLDKDGVAGTADDVEDIARWDGERGVFTEALLECRLINRLDDGLYAIHNYWEHAPHYIKERLRKRGMRYGKQKIRVDANNKDTQEYSKQIQENNGQTTEKCQQVPKSAHLLSQVPKSDSILRPIPKLIQKEEINSSADPPEPSPQQDESQNYNYPQEGRPSAQDIRFGLFWNAYPEARQSGMVKAKEAFMRMEVDDTLLAEILKALKGHKASEQWQSDGGKWIPGPVKWLEEKRWNDKMPAKLNTSAWSADNPQETPF